VLFEVDERTSYGGTPGQQHGMQWVGRPCC